MAVVWPSSLPDPYLLQSQLVMGQNVVHFETASGPGKVRARSTLPMKKMSVPMILTNTQMQAFEEFFEVDLESGALPFELEHPLTGDFKEMRFTPNTPPSFNVITGGAEPKWRGQLSIDILRDGTA